MKKLLLSVAFLSATFIGANAQTTISQNTNPTSVVEGGGVGCPTFPNNYSRSYVLAQHGISTDWEISQVEFGMQTYTAGDQVTITISTASQAYPAGYPGSLTQLFTQNFTWPEDGDFILKQVDITPTVVPAGSEVVVEISGSIWCGGNSLGNTAPAYLWATGCSVTSPTSVADIGFGDAHIIINLVGTAVNVSTEDFASNFSVYPNPATNVINVTNSADVINDVTITDLNGRTVKQVTSGVNDAQINISDLAQGVYILNATSNGKSFTQKVVKQ
jgi:hypothetical protein